MPAVHILAADRINADTAGRTSTWLQQLEHRQEQNTPPATMPELVGGEGFGHIFSGGFHPEAIPGVVTTALESATDSRPGPNGGLQPVYGSVLQPGPAGHAARGRGRLAITLRNIGAALGGHPTVTDG